jgi:protein-tyrosine phosphatase
MHLLVVCTANIARSPLADAMLSASLEPHGVEVISAGTQAIEGHPAAELTQKMAARRGLDLSGHRSQVVTASLVGEAALVVTMSERHRDRCAPLAAGAGSHVFTLRELVRLLRAADLDDAPAQVSERLGWVVDRAHLARPSAPPAAGPEDVHDPIRDPEPAWVQMASVLDQLCGELVEALGVSPGWDAPLPAAEDPGVLGDRTAGRRRRPRWARGSVR